MTTFRLQYNNKDKHWKTVPAAHWKTYVAPHKAANKTGCPNSMIKLCCVEVDHPMPDWIAYLTEYPVVIEKKCNGMTLASCNDDFFHGILGTSGNRLVYFFCFRRAASLQAQWVDYYYQIKMGEICTFNVKVFADTIIRKKRMLKGRTEFRPHKRQRRQNEAAIAPPPTSKGSTPKGIEDIFEPSLGEEKSSLCQDDALWEKSLPQSEVLSDWTLEDNEEYPDETWALCYCS